MTDAILAHNCAIFLSQLAEWQSANDGESISRTVTEWRNATGLDELDLLYVQQHLRETGRLKIAAVHAWAYALEGGQ